VPTGNNVIYAVGKFFRSTDRGVIEGPEERSEKGPPPEEVTQKD